MRNIFIKLIELYQSTLSPDYGLLKHNYPYGFCPQHPTCSEYAKKIIQECGVIVGSMLSLKRVISCHPWKKPSDQKIIQKSL